MRTCNSGSEPPTEGPAQVLTGGRRQDGQQPTSCPKPGGWRKEREIGSRAVASRSFESRSTGLLVVAIGSPAADTELPRSGAGAEDSAAVEVSAAVAAAAVGGAQTSS
jgi:hypothetical protein